MLLKMLIRYRGFKEFVKEVSVSVGGISNVLSCFIVVEHSVKSGWKNTLNKENYYYN